MTLVLFLGLLSSCAEEMGEGIVMEKSSFMQLSGKEREQAIDLFDGDYYYRVRMISGKFVGDTLNVVNIDEKREKGDTVSVVADGREHDLLLIENF